jgi:exodeoxyribonuclease VII small subunit
MAKKQATVSDTSTQLDFEATLKELEQIVQALEHGELSLEASLAQFERGIALTRNCREALNSAEQKVSQLVGLSNSAQLAPFENESESV